MNGPKKFTESELKKVGVILTDAERGRIIAANGAGFQIPIRYNVLGYTYTRVVDGALVDTVSVETRAQIEVLPFRLDDDRTTFTPSLSPVVRTDRSGQSLRASIDVQAKPFAATCPAADGATCVPGQWLADHMPRRCQSKSRVTLISSS